MGAMRSTTIGLVVMLVLVLVLGLAGCGSLGEAAVQSGEVTLRTLIDLLLTDFTNQVADTLSGEGPPPTDGGDDQPDDGDGDDQPDDGDGQPDEPGEMVFFSSDIQPILNDRCISCHVPGGFAQDQGIPLDLNEDAAFDDLVDQASAQDATVMLVVPGDPESSLMFLMVSSESPPVGSMMPLGGPPLADGEIELIRLWIEQGALRVDDDGGTGGGSVSGGESLYGANNCSACHCADASGGCALSAPPLVGAEPSTLSDFLGGVSSHAGGQLELSEQDLLDLAAYLASL